MNKDLRERILRYSSIAGAVAGVTPLTAQEMYTDIPDTTIDTNGGFYDLDLNQDGRDDFRIIQFVDSGLVGNTNAIFITPLDSVGNKVVGEALNGYNYPARLLPGNTIFRNSNFNGVGGSNNYGYMAFVVDGQGGYPNSNWVGPVEDGYLGLLINVGDSTLFGWARLNVSDSSKSFTLKDFSVSTKDEGPIQAGSVFLDQAELLMEKLKWFVREDELVIDFEAKGRLNWRVIDLQGRTILEGSARPGRNLIDIHSLSTGIHVLQFEHNGVQRNDRFLKP